jgi:hypothetical protein
LQQNEKGDLLAELGKHIEEKIDLGLLNEFRKTFMPRSLVESSLMKHASKIKKLTRETSHL